MTLAQESWQPLSLIKPSVSAFTHPMEGGVQETKADPTQLESATNCLS